MTTILIVFFIFGCALFDKENVDLFHEFEKEMERKIEFDH